MIDDDVGGHSGGDSPELSTATPDGDASLVASMRQYNLELPRESRERSEYKLGRVHVAI